MLFAYMHINTCNFSVSLSRVTGCYIFIALQVTGQTMVMYDSTITPQGTEMVLILSWKEYHAILEVEKGYAFLDIVSYSG